MLSFIISPINTTSPHTYTSMSSSITQPFNQSKFYTEATRIVAAHTAHFLALAFLFIFPLWLSIISVPLFVQTKILPLNNLKSHTSFLPITLSFLYTALLFSLYVAGVATITYSTHHGFLSRPLNLFTTIKSLSHSFFPLAYTILASLVILFLLCTGPLLYAGLILYTISFFGFEINSSSYFFIAFCVFIFIIELLVLVFCQVCSVLTGTIAIVESKWGVEPLHETYHLIRGINFVAISLFFLYGIIIWVLVAGLAYHISLFGQRKRVFLDVFLDVLQTAALSIPALLIMVQFVAATTVLYLHYKDSNEELGFESSNEYVTLAVDDDNVARH